MAKIPYDMRGVDTGGAELPPPGIYKAKVSKMTDETPEGKARRLVVVVDLTDPKYKGFRLWKYISLPFDKKSPSAWMQAQFLAATKGDEKGGIDPDRPGDLREFKVDLRHREWDGEMRGDLKAFIPLTDDDEPEDEDEEEGDEDEGDDSEVTMEELESYTSKELLEFLGENNLEAPEGLPRAASAKKAALLEFIKEELFADDEDEPEDDDDEEEESDEDEDEDEESEDEVDLQVMSLAELKVYAQENGISLPAGLKGTRGKTSAIAAIETALESAEDEDEEDDDGDDYDEWDLAELKKELADRSLKVTGKVTVAKIIAALRADDAEENPV